MVAADYPISATATHIPTNLQLLAFYTTIMRTRAVSKKPDISMDQSMDLSMMSYP